MLHHNAHSFYSTEILYLLYLFFPLKGEKSKIVPHGTVNFQGYIRVLIWEHCMSQEGVSFKTKC